MVGDGLFGGFMVTTMVTAYLFVGLSTSVNSVKIHLPFSSGSSRGGNSDSRIKTTDAQQITKAGNPNDPFRHDDVGEQVTAAAAGVNCGDPNKKWVDWVLNYNASLNRTANEVISFASGNDYNLCFQACAGRVWCAAFTFQNSTSPIPDNGQCQLFSAVNPENVLYTEESTLSLRDWPLVAVAGEWLVTRDERPRGPSLVTLTNIANWFECLSLCGSQDWRPSCKAAAYSLTTKTCTIYDIEEPTGLRVDANFVTALHASLIDPSPWYKFEYIGHFYPAQPANPAYSLSFANIQSCLKECANNEQCQVAATTSLTASVVKCDIFYEIQPTFDEQNPPAPYINSFYLRIPSSNSMYRPFPHYVRLVGTPVQVVQTPDVDGCHDIARQNSVAFFYSFNQPISICTLYSKQISLEIPVSVSSFDVKSFSRTWSSNPDIEFSFDEIFWIPSLPQSVSISSIGPCQLDQRLTACLGDPSCYGVALNGQGNWCVELTSDDMRQAENVQLQSLPVTLSFQIYRKSVDIRFLDDTATIGRYKCLDSPSFDWAKFFGPPTTQELATFGNSIDKDDGGKCPLQPHSPIFWPNGKTLMSPTISTVPTNFPPRASEPFGPMVGSGVGSGIVRHQFGRNGLPLMPNAAAGGVNQVVNRKRPPPNEDKTPCFIIESGAHEDLKRSASAGVATRANPMCTDQASTASNNGGVPQEDVGDLQDRCINAPLRTRCNLCCQVGYEPVANATCKCRNSNSAHWDPLECTGRFSCQIQEKTLSNNLAVMMVPIRNCQNFLYYGVAFRRLDEIPFFTVYKYTVESTQNRRPGLPRPDWKNFACRQRQFLESQWGDADMLIVRNANRRGRAGPNFNMGHLVPYGDLSYLRDAQVASQLYINALPQDAWTNSGPWNTLEERVRNYLRSRTTLPHYIMTGGCLAVNGHVPACFWKMVCIQTGSGIALGAFYHDNTYVYDQDNVAMANRRNQVSQVRLPVFLDQFVGQSAASLWGDASALFSGTEGAAVFNCQFPTVRFPSAFRELLEMDEGEGNFTQSPIPDLHHQSTTTSDHDDDDDQKSDDEETGKVGAMELFVAEDDSVPQTNLESKNPPDCDRLVIGYLTGCGSRSFGLDQASYLTHVVFAFVQMNANGSLEIGSPRPADTGHFDRDRNASYWRLYEMQRVKYDSNLALQTMFAVGGWDNSEHFSEVAANDQLRNNFASSVIQIIDLFDMDGVDINWIYPVTGGAQAGSPSDKENYVALLSTVRAALDKHRVDKGRKFTYLLTIAGAPWPSVLDAGFQLEFLAPLVDWINIKSVDYFGPWDSSKGSPTGPIAPLYFGAPRGYSGKQNVDSTLQYYACKVGDLNKLVLGLGFYGRYWNHTTPPLDPNDPLWRQGVRNGLNGYDGGFVPWSTVSSDFILNPLYEMLYDQPTRTPYLAGVNNGDFFMAYENPQSIYEKVKYVGAKQLAGVNLWSLTMDDLSFTMTRTAASSVLCGGNGIQQLSDVPKGYSCSRVAEKRWWSVNDGPNALRCGRQAPLYPGPGGYYPVCDPDDPAYSCCQTELGLCGNGNEYCKCQNCVDYGQHPQLVWINSITP